MIKFFGLDIKIKYFLLLGFILFMPVLSAVVLADNDYIEARRLYNSGEILPLQEILKIVRQIQPGKILEVELEKEDGKIVYELEILNDEGVVKEFYIDARTGQVQFAAEDN